MTVIKVIQKVLTTVIIWISLTSTLVIMIMILTVVVPLHDAVKSLRYLNKTRSFFRKDCSAKIIIVAFFVSKVVIFLLSSMSNEGTSFLSLWFRLPPQVAGQNPPQGAGQISPQVADQKMCLSGDQSHIPQLV